jgi:tetratricopeptide (TPR) repeat protein
MHHRAGRAIKAVIEGNVEEPVRNEAIFRLARLYFRKDQPVNALHALQRIHGTVPDRIRDDLEFLRAHVLMANGRNVEAARILKEMQGAEGYEGFAAYNLGIALMREGLEQEGRQFLDRNGQIGSDVPATLAIKDKSNLVLGDKLLEEKSYDGAKLVLDRVRLSGPFSNRALLGSGWADAFQGRFERALVPWSILFQREITDPSVQQALLALPYAYGKLGVYSKAALLYGRALEAFGAEVDKLDASIKSIREGKFLQALTREELKQDANWVVKLRELPETPETYYLLELMASHDFQESLKNYLDLEELRRKLAAWEDDLDAFEELIQLRRAYFRPLLPKIDRKFRRLDSQMRLRLEQRDLIQQRLEAMLTAPRPDHLATGHERILGERVSLLERELKEGARRDRSPYQAPAGRAALEHLHRLRPSPDGSAQESPRPQPGRGTAGEAVRRFCAHPPGRDPKLRRFRQRDQPPEAPYRGVSGKGGDPDGPPGAYPRSHGRERIVRSA